MGGELPPLTQRWGSRCSNSSLLQHCFEDWKIWYNFSCPSVSALGKQGKAGQCRCRWHSWRKGGQGQPAWPALLETRGFFLPLCFSSLPCRLTLIPAGGTGPLVTLVRQLGVTTTVISPYSNYSFTIQGTSWRWRWADAQTERLTGSLGSKPGTGRALCLPSFQWLCVSIYHQVDPSMLPMGTFNWETDFLLHFFSFSLFFPQSFHTIQLNTLCLLDLVFAAFCSTVTQQQEISHCSLPQSAGAEGDDNLIAIFWSIWNRCVCISSSFLRDRWVCSCYLLILVNSCCFG